MKITSIIILTLITISSCFAQQKEHFRGGMLLHTGYLSNNNKVTPIDGLCQGIGGKMVFPLYSGIRIGAEGYVSNYSYKQSTGFFKLGWGGMLLEYQFSQKRLRPVAGLSIGGGKIRDLYPLLGNYDDNDPDVAIYKIYSSMILAPQISIEYSITQHINLVGKIDYLLYPGCEYADFIPSGTRFYVGFLFSR